MQKQILKGSLAAAATISMLVACGPAPTGEPKPSVAPSSTASVEPSTAPTVAPTTEPTVAPTVAPTTEPTVAPTTAPTVAPTTAPTAAPTAVATSDISVVEKTTFNGKVYDDTNAPLDGVTVKAKSLNSAVVYQETTSTAGGAYAFNNAPSGVQVEITASPLSIRIRSALISICPISRSCSARSCR